MFFNKCRLGVVLFLKQQTDKKLLKNLLISPYYDSSYLGIDKFIRIRQATEKEHLEKFGKDQPKLASFQIDYDFYLLFILR